MTSLTTALLGLLLVGAAVYESVMHGKIDGDLLVLATAVVTVYFTGTTVRQVNGTKIDTLTAAVTGLHTRLDSAGIPPAGDGTASPSGA